MYSFGKKQKEIKLSEYFKKRKFDDKDDKVASEILMEYLGDVSLPVGIIEQFLDYYTSAGGRYDVRSEKESTLGLYDFYRKFPTITPEAFDDVSFMYIKDLFDKYDLIKYFEDMIAKYGKTDEAFSKFIKHVDKSADLLQVKYDHDALKMNKYYALYGEKKDAYYIFDGFISHLYDAIKNKHLPVDKVIDGLPSYKLIDKDRDHWNELFYGPDLYRCTLHLVPPISYSMVETYAKGEDLFKVYGKRPMYKLASGKLVRAKFTTQEYLDDIKKDMSEKRIKLDKPKKGSDKDGKVK